ncbi:hypothetical protein DIT71_05810 [Marinobacter vulgaris]|uniref:DUF7352 domain-containing protein n=1 Tax=Marinobacter vulgaris TaxID=1928331 RepID=A0A2V3ZNM8_9GAMM|nr:hypothetical protein [Marinobacter vulgaris]PXX92692.1 hypothetical protein DIT71_05810 [Marinobacter vulgaris]TSJ71360.1 hypothetical protein FPC41_03655 [Marinobacter vulgaris]
MKTIHKFRLEMGKEPNTLKLREGYRVVRCEYLVSQKGVYLWVEQPLNVAIPMVERQFVVVYSGDPVPVSYQHLDTALDPFGPEAYHVFEVAEAPVSKPVASNQQANPILFRPTSQQVGTA